MMQSLSTDSLAGMAAVLLTFSPLIVFPLRAALDPAAAIALWNRFSSATREMNPPWMLGSRYTDTLPNTSTTRAVVRLLSSTLIAVAFFRLAERLSHLVR